jgi:hypothetical protein
MFLTRQFALLLAVLATFAVSACSNPTATGADIKPGVSCNSLQPGCSGD